jgi:phosphoribosylanthranilate isomerase
MALIKICGITRLEDALASVDAGADLLGFNFYPRSSRYIPPAKARIIIEKLRNSVLCVGVFVNEAKPDSVRSIAAESGIGMLQLHGDESPDYCQSFEIPVIKAFRSSATFNLKDALEFKVDSIMLDAFDTSSRGGTGHLANWKLARSLGELFPKFFLAGGLSPLNISEALSAVGPYGVDACSGLEISPGIKDHSKLREFVRLVKTASP